MHEVQVARVKHNVPLHEYGREDHAAILATCNAISETDKPPAIITPGEAAIFHLRHNRDRALHCPNPACPAPYFFRIKKGQKFCSRECAKPSQCESKRLWWASNRGSHGRSRHQDGSGVDGPLIHHNDHALCTPKPAASHRSTGKIVRINCHHNCHQAKINTKTGGSERQLSY